MKGHLGNLCVFAWGPNPPEKQPVVGSTVPSQKIGKKALLPSPFRFSYPEEGVEKNVDPFTTTYSRLGSIESMYGDEFTNVLGALKNKMRKKERPARFVKGVFQTVKLTWRCPHRPTGCIRAKTDLRADLCWP